MSSRRGRGGGAGGGVGSKSLLSGKAKKEQMKEKREKERLHAEKQAAWEKRQQEAIARDIHQRHMQQQPNADDHKTSSESHTDDDEVLAVRRINPSPSSSSSSITPSSVPVFAALESSGGEVRNKLRTIFIKETKEEIERRKVESRKPLNRSGPLDGSCPSPNPWHDLIPIPIRPPWSPTDTPAELHARETSYFHSYLESIYSKYSPSRLNHFEHNLEVWRQLWRVCEQSDVLLCIVDCRYPLLNFAPSLYSYVTQQLSKPFVVVLNKIDLIPASVLQQWKDWFRQAFPTLAVVGYTSQPREGITNESFDVLKKNKVKQAGGGLVLGDAYGVKELMEVVREVVRENGRLPEEVIENFSFEPSLIREVERERKEERKDGGEGDDKEEEDDEDNQEEAQEEQEEEEDRPQKGKRKGRSNTGRGGGGRAPQSVDDEEEHVDEDEEPQAEAPSQYRSLFGQLDDAPSSSAPSRSYITIGTIGCPNSGKSSLINSLAHRKLVSVSKTPGHTKYLQTLFLNPFTRLCDCPGLVFPAVDLPKALQTLAGCFPIAQTRDPYSAVRLLAEHVPLERTYKLKPVPVDERGDWTYGDGEEGDWQWTAWSICEAYAYQKGYRNKHGILDLYRAANAICRDALEGVVYTTPPKEGQRGEAVQSGGTSTQREMRDGEARFEENKGQIKEKGRERRKGKARKGEEDESDDEAEEEAQNAKKGKGKKGRRRRRDSDDDEEDTDK